MILNQMVKYQQHTLDATFAALADPTRRAILARLAAGQASVTELAAPFAVSLPAILKHVSVLARAGLVAQRKEGRVQRCRLEAGPLRGAAEWVSRYRVFWERQFEALDRYLQQTDKQEETTWPPPISNRKSRSTSKGSSRPRGKKSSGPGPLRKP